MATITGRDVILSLMNDVAELKAGSQETSVRLERMGKSLNEMSGTVSALAKNVDALAKNVEAMAKNVDALGENVEGLIGHVGVLASVTGAQTKRLDRMGRTLSKLADVLGDHEARISALEATVH